MKGNVDKQRNIDLWPDSGAVMIDVQRIRELRVLIKTTEKELADLENDGKASADAATKEMVVLEATRLSDFLCMSHCRFNFAVSASHGL